MAYSLYHTVEDKRNFFQEALKASITNKANDLVNNYQETVAKTSVVIGTFNYIANEEIYKALDLFEEHPNLYRFLFKKKVKQAFVENKKVMDTMLSEVGQIYDIKEWISKQSFLHKDLSPQLDELTETTKEILLEKGVAEDLASIIAQCNTALVAIDNATMMFSPFYEAQAKTSRVNLESAFGKWKLGNVRNIWKSAFEVILGKIENPCADKRFVVGYLKLQETISDGEFLAKLYDEENAEGKNSIEA